MTLDTRAPFRGARRRRCRNELYPFRQITTSARESENLQAASISGQGWCRPRSELVLILIGYQPHACLLGQPMNQNHRTVRIHGIGQTPATRGLLLGHLVTRASPRSAHVSLHALDIPFAIYILPVSHSIVALDVASNTLSAVFPYSLLATFADAVCRRQAGEESSIGPRYALCGRRR